MINNEDELEELLSRPTDRDKAVITSLEGPILILGAGGKMGPTLAIRAKRAGAKQVIAVARFSSAGLRRRIEREGIETISADLIEPDAVYRLPDAPHVIFMAAMKFGTTGAEHLTWAMNTYLPGRVAERYRSSRIVAFSTGNVYPLVPVTSGGATEGTLQLRLVNTLNRPSVASECSNTGPKPFGTPGVLLRLNYACRIALWRAVDIGIEGF